MTDYEKGFLAGLEAAALIANDRAEDELDPWGGDQKRYDGCFNVMHAIKYKIDEMKKASHD